MGDMVQNVTGTLKLKFANCQIFASKLSIGPIPQPATLQDLKNVWPAMPV